MRIPLKQVFWTQHTQAGGEFGKSLATSAARGIKLWFVGLGVLVEHGGHLDRMVPIGNVLSMDAEENLSPEQWSGEAKEEPPAPAPLKDEPTPKPKRRRGRPRKAE